MPKRTILPGKPLFIDTSNLIFITAEGICAYMKHHLDPDVILQSKEDDDFSWLEQSIIYKGQETSFENLYMLRFEGRILELLKKFKIVPSDIIFLIDCMRDDIWRCGFFNAYKAQRKCKSHISYIFQLTMEKLLPDLISKWNCNIVQADNAEADDVCAVLIKEIRRVFPPTLQIYVISNDKDYQQLAKYNVTFIDARGGGKIIAVDPDANIIADKIEKGDSADNIPGNSKMRSSCRLAHLFTSYIKLHLMSFDYIPLHIQADIISQNSHICTNITKILGPSDTSTSTKQKSITDWLK